MEEEPGGATFVWTDPDMRHEWRFARRPETAADIRNIEDIAFEELRASLPEGLLLEDCLASAARVFGMRRLTQQARAKLLRFGEVGRT